MGYYHLSAEADMRVEIYTDSRGRSDLSIIPETNQDWELITEAYIVETHKYDELGDTWIEVTLQTEKDNERSPKM